MNIVYDLFLNFQEQAYDFYEWTKQDTLEHIKKIPMFRISSKTMIDFFTKDVQISKEFLEGIYNITEKYDLNRLEYVCLFSDGKVALAVEFSKDGYSIYKSRLLLEDEDEIVRYMPNEEMLNLEYSIISNVQDGVFFTRKEKKIKRFLEKEITKAYQNKERLKLQYLYLEYFDEIEEDLNGMKKKLLNSMKTTLDKKHFNLYELLLLLSKKKKV